MKKILLFFSLILFFSAIHAQTWLWAYGDKNSTKKSNANVNAITVDSLGYIYETGSYEDTVTFGSYTLMDGSNNGNVFTVKYDGNGNVIWLKSSMRLNKSAYGEANAVCTDLWGNIYVGGDGSDTLLFNADTIIGTNVGFIVKYNSNGTVLWARGVTVTVNGLGTDKAGNLYSVSQSNASLVKYDSSGKKIWATSASAPGGYGESTSLTISNEGTIFVAGQFRNKLIIKGDSVSSPSFLSDIFLAKFDTSGNISWLISPHTSGYAEVPMVAADRSGNVYLEGLFNDTLVIGTNTFISKGNNNTVFAKYASNGAVLWSQIPIHKGPNVITESYYGGSVCVDQWNNVYFGSTLKYD